MSYIFDEGEEVDVGSPQQNDFVFSEGELLSDGDQSDFIGIEGVGLGQGLTAEMVGHWKLDESTGGTAFDSTANENHGGIVGDPIMGVETPLSHTGYTFDGQEDGVIIPHDSAINPTRDLSVTAWVKTTSSGAVAVKRDANRGRWDLQITGAGHARFDPVALPGNNANVTGVTDVADGEWHLIGGTYNYNTGEAQIWVDAESENSSYNSGLNLSNNGDLSIGFETEGTRNHIPATIVDCRVFFGDLTESGMSVLYGMGT